MSVLRLESISKGFGGIQALTDLSFELEPGKITGLIGPNGAGKTTAFNVICGYLRPEQGRVCYKDREITSLAPHQITRMGIARSFQDLRLFPKMTALENVLVAFPGQSGEGIFASLFLGPRLAAEQRRNVERAGALLDFVGLAGMERQLADSLSYAEQKLLVIARLLAAEADVLLLDEPASGLDKTAVQRVLGLLHRVAEQGKTICIIEHNLDIVKDVSDWIVFLDLGRAVMSGPPKEILSNPHLAEIYFGSEGPEATAAPQAASISSEGAQPLLQLHSVVAGYGNQVVLSGVSLNVNEGEVVVLIGHNGAGKTTALGTMFGSVRVRNGRITFAGRDIVGHKPAASTGMGLSMVPQGRPVFPDLTVLENLYLGAHSLADKTVLHERLNQIYELFPILRERLGQKAGTLSGGQQQMLGIAMALLLRPKLLLLDEPSLGLAPLLVQNLLGTVREINRRFGTAVLLVEQNVKQALKVADRVYVMKVGQVVLETTPDHLLEATSLWEMF